MKRGLVPGGAVLMGLVVSLAFIGVGYGLWADTLRINGAVSTGSVNAAFSLHELDEGLLRGAPNGPADNDQNEDLEAGGVDIAECFVRIYSPVSATADEALDAAVTDEALISRPASDFLFVGLRNAYPGYNCYVDFDVHNAGSIPLKVNKPILGPVPAAGILNVEFQSCYEDGTQVEPGKEVLCTLHVQVGRAIQPNTLYRFGATICAYQWNANAAVRCAVPTDIEAIPADIATELTPVEVAPATRP